MPPSPRLDESSAPITRSRSGCWSCKKRRRKCTGERPSCSACQKRSQICQYGLRLLWQDEAEDAGIAFGRAGIKDQFSSKSDDLAASHKLLPIPKRRQWWLNTTARDMPIFCQKFQHHANSTDIQLSDELDDDDDDDRQEDGFAVPAASDKNTDPLTLLYHLRTIPCLDGVGAFLFHYYEHVVSSQRVLLDGPQNPFRTLVLPVCHSSQSLLHAVIAAAANDLKNRKDISGTQSFAAYDRAVLLHKSKALEHLRCQIQIDHHQNATATSLFSLPSQQHYYTPMTDLAERDSMLLTTMMLCYLEIASGGRTRWTAHLKGALSLVRFYQNAFSLPDSSVNGSTLPPLFSPQALRFAYDYFALREVFSATTTSNEGHSFDHSNDYLQDGCHCCWKTYLPALYPQLLNEDEPMRISFHLGLSPELLDIISSVTTLNQRKSSAQLERQRSSNSAVGQSGGSLKRSQDSKKKRYCHFIEHAAAIETRLANLRQWSDEPDQDHLIYLIAGTFEEACWIYLLHGAHDKPWDDPRIQNEHLPKLFELLQRVHMKQGDLLGSLPYPMWALFIGGCVVPEQMRIEVLDLFMALKARRPFSNVPRTMKAVLAVWKHRDLSCDAAANSTRRLLMNEVSHSGPLPSPTGQVLEWASTLVTLGWKLALT